MPLIFIVVIIIMGLCKHDSTMKTIKKMDENPCCTVKSDDWKRKHGLLK